MKYTSIAAFVAIISSAAVKGSSADYSLSGANWKEPMC